MLRFEGDRVFPGSAQHVFARLTNPHFLVPCVPDVETVKTVDDSGADLVLKPGFAFLRGTLEVAMRQSEVDPPHRVHFEMNSKGIGSSATVQATLTFQPQGDEHTAVHWVAEVKSLGGLLKLVPPGLIRGAAEKVINDAWERITLAMVSPPADSTEATPAGST
ncbi:MAG: SRPBCC domain-containing protein [Gemmataceae bacterium]